MSELKVDSIRQYANTDGVNFPNGLKVGSTLVKLGEIVSDDFRGTVDTGIGFAWPATDNSMTSKRYVDLSISNLFNASGLSGVSKTYVDAGLSSASITSRNYSDNYFLRKDTWTQHSAGGITFSGSLYEFTVLGRNPVKVTSSLPAVLFTETDTPGASGTVGMEGGVLKLVYGTTAGNNLGVRVTSTGRTTITKASGTDTTITGLNPHSALRVDNSVSSGQGVSLEVAGSGDILLANNGSLFFQQTYDYNTGTYIRPLQHPTTGLTTLRFTTAGNNVADFDSTGVNLLQENLNFSQSVGRIEIQGTDALTFSPTQTTSSMPFKCRSTFIGGTGGILLPYGTAAQYIEFQGGSENNFPQNVLSSYPWAGQTAGPPYAIYREPGTWDSSITNLSKGHPYPDLCIQYHTGIKIVAYHGYGGTRFYSRYNVLDEDQIIMSVGQSDHNVRIRDNLYVGGTRHGGGYIGGNIGASGQVSANQFLLKTPQSQVVSTYASGLLPQGIWSLAESFKLKGTTSGDFSGFYGLCYAFTKDYTTPGNNPFSKLNGWQTLYVQNGAVQTAIGNGIWTNGGITATSDILSSGKIIGAQMFAGDSQYAGNQSSYKIYADADTNAAGFITRSVGYGIYGQAASSYGIVGRTVSSDHGGVLGYNHNASVYGILGHSDKYSLYGNGAAFSSKGTYLEMYAVNYYQNQGGQPAAWGGNWNYVPPAGTKWQFAIYQDFGKTTAGYEAERDTLIGVYSSGVWRWEANGTTNLGTQMLNLLGAPNYGATFAIIIREW